MRSCYTLLLGILKVGVQGAQSILSISSEHWRSGLLHTLTCTQLTTTLTRAFNADEFVIDRVGWSFPSSGNELDDVRKLLGLWILMCLVDRPIAQTIEQITYYGVNSGSR